MSESEVSPSSSSEELTPPPRWWERRWCFTIVVLRQKLERVRGLEQNTGGLGGIPLQAALVGAFIRAFTGVNTAMASETR